MSSFMYHVGWIQLYSRYNRYIVYTNTALPWDGEESNETYYTKVIGVSL